jgi:nucleoside-diphosphate-sugar epimerase
MSTNRILITGATGFVGRHLVPMLLSKHHSITLAIRRPEACLLRWQNCEQLRLVTTGSIETSQNLREALEGVSTIVHLAALAHVHDAGHVDNDGPFVAANITATERLVEAAGREDVGAFINLSSLAAVTGNASSITVDDKSYFVPPTAYGRSKRAAENAVHGLRDKGVFAVSLRPPLIVGADARGNWATLQRLAATGLPLPFGGVRNKRSMIGVRALAEAIAHLCARPWPAAKSGAYCLADPDPVTLPEVIRELRAGMGLAPRLFPFPGAILLGAATALNQRNRAAGLLGSLEVDSSRFRQAFAFTETQRLHAAIRESGAQYMNREHLHERLSAN